MPGAVAGATLLARELLGEEISEDAADGTADPDGGADPNGGADPAGTAGTARGAGGENTAW